MKRGQLVLRFAAIQGYVGKKLATMAGSKREMGARLIVNSRRDGLVLISLGVDRPVVMA